MLLKTFNRKLTLMNWRRATRKQAHVWRIFSIHVHISRAKLPFSSGRDCGEAVLCCSRKKQATKVQWRRSVSSIMSVFLPKRVKLGSQIGAYWGILSLCLDLYFLWQPHDRGWFNMIIYSAAFPASHRVTYRTFSVLFLIIRMSPICLESERRLGVRAVYCTKIDINKIVTSIQNKTQMYRIKCRDSPCPPSSSLNLLSSHLLSFLIIFSLTSPLPLVSLPRVICTLYLIGAPCHHLCVGWAAVLDINKSLQLWVCKQSTHDLPLICSSVSLSNLNC